MNTNHQPWDNGAIDAAFTQVFRVGARELTRQKTVKTKRGKRVPVAQAVAGQPITCFQCNEQICAEKEFTLSSAIELNDQNIIRAIAERTLGYAIDYLYETRMIPKPHPEFIEVLLVAQEVVVAEQIAARGI